MVENTPSLASVLTRLFFFAIQYATLVFPSRWSMDHMPHLCFSITFWLSILLSYLPVNSNVGLTFSTIISLGKPKQRALSSFHKWVVMINLPIMLPIYAHLTPVSPSWNLFFYEVICIFSQSELFLRGVKICRQHPLSLKIRALLRNLSNLTYGTF